MIKKQRLLLLLVLLVSSTHAANLEGFRGVIKIIEQQKELEKYLSEVKSSDIVFLAIVNEEYINNGDIAYLRAIYEATLDKRLGSSLLIYAGRITPYIQSKYISLSKNLPHVVLVKNSGQNVQEYAAGKKPAFIKKFLERLRRIEATNSVQSSEEPMGTSRQDTGEL